MENFLIEKASTLSNGPKDCSTPKVFSERHERSSMHALKESTNSNGSLATGKTDENKLKKKIVFDNKASSSSLHSMKIFQDDSIDSDHHVRCSRSVQTDDSLLETYVQNKQLNNLNVSTDSGHLSACFDQEAYDLMVNETVPENYWKDLAEQRRKALNDTLEENENLSFEVEHLKKENIRLSDIASKAEYLENLLNEVLSDDKEQDDEADDQSTDQKLETTVSEPSDKSCSDSTDTDSPVSEKNKDEEETCEKTQAEDS